MRLGPELEGGECLTCCPLSVESAWGLGEQLAPKQPLRVWGLSPAFALH